MGTQGFLCGQKGMLVSHNGLASVECNRYRIQSVRLEEFKIDHQGRVLGTTRV